MSDAIRRAVRTFVQTFLGSVIASGALSALTAEGVVDWSALKKTGISAIVAGVVSIVSFVQNSLEDTGVIPPLLKSPPAVNLAPAVEPVNAVIK